MAGLAIKNLSSRGVLIAGGLLALVIITGTAGALWLYRNAALSGGEWHLKNIAVALAEQTRQGVLTADIAFRATAEEYGAQAALGTVSEELLHQRMHQRVAELPQLRSLLVIGQDGRIRYSLVGEINLGHDLVVGRIAELLPRLPFTQNY